MKKKRNKRWMKRRVRYQATLDRRRRFETGWDKLFEGIGVPKLK